MVTLVFVICIAAIFCFFSQEFIEFFKKIFAIRGVALILPLVFASYIVFNYDYLVLWFLLYIRDYLNAINDFFLRITPQKKYTADAVLVLLLTLVSVGPVVLLNLWSQKKAFKPFAYPYLVSTLIWVIAATVLISLPALYH